MGVCKCKQRNVTNQFCYVCRMNVCESCMIKDHQRCIIKSYVHWLQDSDYSPVCSLCLESLENGEVVRLSCYDLFHWDCLNAWALKFPETNAPSTYQCPDCKVPIFPSSALVSPVADVLRQKLSTVGWGRRGLGLSVKEKEIIPNNEKKESSSSVLQTKRSPTSTPQVNSSIEYESKKVPYLPMKPKKQPVQQQQQQSQQQQQKEPQKALYSRDKYSNESLRKVIDTRYDESKINMSYDHDENKYKRKGLFHILGNLLRLTSDLTPKKKMSKNKKLIISFLIILFGFMGLIYFMSSVGRTLNHSDPLLDPENNPNIRVAQNNIAQQISR